MTIAFIGHKKITVTNDLINKTHDYIKSLIVNKNADTFLFGSNSQFNDFCYKIVTELKETYPHIQRIYIRAEYENIKADYLDYLLSIYEETYFPLEAHNAGYKVYVKRNQVMIDKCDELVIYYDTNYTPAHRSSGTVLAIKYAKQKNKICHNIFGG
jgi:uncharacterized phage-like protein YoqJ